MRLRIKEICDYVSRGTTPDYVDEGTNKVMNQATFSKGWIDESNIRYTSKANKGARIMKGDLLMASTGGGVLGKVFFFDDDDSFYADSHVTIMRNSKGANLMKYLYYYFYLRYEEINATMVKGSTNQTELQRNYLLSYELDVPTLADQQRMITYLDTKLSEIDHQVSLLTSKRDAYLRLKKSIINHVVTHGLNPNVKMKDSGIEWIGEVPEHWEVKRMKELSAIGSGTTPKSGEDKYYENGIHPWLNTSDVQDCVINEAKFSITDKALNDYSVLKYYPIGTILIAMYGGGTIGNVALMNISATINQACCAIVSNEKLLLPKYLFCYLKCHKKKIISLGFGGTQVNLSQAIIAQLPVVLPPLPEQRAIATYLDDKCAKIDTIVSNFGKQISRYADLKRSLIDEVITGKRAV